jgi:hypothetical protein
VAGVPDSTTELEEEGGFLLRLACGLYRHATYRLIRAI